MTKTKLQSLVIPIHDAPLPAPSGSQFMHAVTCFTKSPFLHCFCLKTLLSLEPLRIPWQSWDSI